jgi:flavin-binding protein dodecin
MKGVLFMAVVKIVNMLGSSKKSWHDAVDQAVQEASKTITNITGIEVLNTTGVVKDGRVVEFKANVNVAYALDSEMTTT